MDRIRDRVDSYKNRVLKMRSLLLREKKSFIVFVILLLDY